MAGFVETISIAPIDDYRGLVRAHRLSQVVEGVVVRQHNSPTSHGLQLLAHEEVALLQKRPVHKLHLHTQLSRRQPPSMRMTTRFVLPKTFVLKTKDQKMRSELSRHQRPPGGPRRSLNLALVFP
jgi:hypothetical protein